VTIVILCFGDVLHCKIELNDTLKNFNWVKCMYEQAAFTSTNEERAGV
jgi:hypothetical protein